MKTVRAFLFDAPFCFLSSTLRRTQLFTYTTVAMGCASSEPVALTPQQIATALVDALLLASRIAVDTVSAAGGFGNNAALRIKIPGELGDMMGKLKNLPGLGDKVTEFEENLNRAAELACKAALEVLHNVIRSLTFQDAKAILEGPSDCASRYFEQILRNDLAAKFKPIVQGKVDETGLGTVYNALTTAYNAIPFHNSPAFDLATYVTGKALDGLFATLRQKEGEVRGNKAGYTPAMQQAFGQPPRK